METLLKDVIAHMHDTLAERLETARAAMPDGCQSRRGCPPVDHFLSETSKHLHCFDEVVLPLARRCPEGGHLVKGLLHAQKQLEVALFHVKSHEYGSVWERNVECTAMWREVEEALAGDRRCEEAIADQVDHVLDEAERARAVARLETRTTAEPSRPHPHLPHTGPLGGASRRVTQIIDAWWDMVEGRHTLRQPVRHKAPGLLGQYLLGSPRFEPMELDEDGEPVAASAKPGQRID